MSSMKKAIITVELGNDSMNSPGDLAELLGRIQRVLRQCQDFDDCQSSFRDSNGSTVCHVEFESRFVESRVVAKFDVSKKTLNDVEGFITDLLGENMKELSLDSLIEAEHNSEVTADFTAEVDRDFLENHDFKYKKLVQHISLFISPTE